MRRLEYFTDDEVYMMSRQAVLSSFEISNDNVYSEDEQYIHGQLLNELATERNLRNI